MIFTRSYVKYIKNHFQIGDLDNCAVTFFGWLASKKKMDLFFPEEDQMLRYLREFCGEGNANGEN